MVCEEKLADNKEFKYIYYRIAESAVKIVAMLDTKPYKEWACVYYENGVELFPIGDNLAIRLG